MDIQDLGAIGEFVSSVVIVFTLVILIHEVRSAKRAAQVGNAQARRLARDAVWSMPAESPGLAEALAKADANLGSSTLAESGRKYGLEPDEMIRVANYWNLVVVHWADWISDDLHDQERRSIDLNIETRLANPLYLSLYQRDRAYVNQHPDPQHPMKKMVRYVDDVLASNTALSEKLREINY